MEEGMFEETAEDKTKRAAAKALGGMAFIGFHMACNGYGEEMVREAFLPQVKALASAFHAEHKQILNDALEGFIDAAVKMRETSNYDLAWPMDFVVRYEKELAPGGASIVRAKGILAKLQAARAEAERSETTMRGRCRAPFYEVR